MTKEEWAQRFFEKDGFVKLAGIEILSVSEERAIVRAKIDDRHRNANGSVQGGMLYTVADFAFAVLANSIHPLTVTQGGHISYIRAAVTDEITATATETTRAGHNTVSEVIIRDHKDDVVCVCNFNGFVKDSPLAVDEKINTEERENT